VPQFNALAGGDLLRVSG